MLIAGGGPAGMQAAITAVERGHDVVLCEQGPELGGLLRFTEADSLKADLRRYKDYLIHMVEKRGVKVRLNTPVSPELAETLQPDTILIATGSSPVTPPIPGIERAKHATAAYFEPDCVRGERVVMIGGGLVGVETAMHLENIGKRVTVLEMAEDVARDAGPVYKIGMLWRAQELGVEIRTGCRVTGIDAEGVRFEQAGESVTLPADAVLYAVGMKSEDALYFALADKAPHVALIGDCRQVGKVPGAVHAAYFAAMDIGDRG